MDWIELSEQCMCFGIAAIGFAILFNVPKRTLIAIFILSSVGGLAKILLLNWSQSIVLGTLIGSAIIGFLSIFSAHSKHSPPFVFAIPAVIPMVPGSFAYHTMEGIIKLTTNSNSMDFIPLLESTINNGFKTLFILIAIAVGVSAPMLLTTRDSAKEIKITFHKPD